MLRPEIRIGKTPLTSFNLNDETIVHIKFESYNPFGSMKDRAALNIISKAFKLGLINKNTTIVESSSGNFGIALAAICKMFKLKFICVIDKNTNQFTEKLLKEYNAEVVRIEKPDKNGGYLINRLAKVQEILNSSHNMYWINQYGNPLNAESYYELADEILLEISHPDYIFVPVSSGGTITGVSNRIKEKSPNTKIIAIDCYGSVIFGGQAKKRYIPGMGSSIVPPILKKAIIDDVVTVRETEMIKECRSFLNKTGLMIGGSSGACLSAIRSYKTLDSKKNSIITIFADRGERYLDTIYNDEWCQKNNLL